MNITPVSFGMKSNPILKKTSVQTSPATSYRDPFSNDLKVVEKSVNNALENGNLMFRTPEGRLINISDKIKDALKNHYYIPSPTPYYVPDYASEPTPTPTPLPNK